MACEPGRTAPRGSGDASLPGRSASCCCINWRSGRSAHRIRARRGKWRGWSAPGRARRPWRWWSRAWRSGSADGEGCAADRAARMWFCTTTWFRRRFLTWRRRRGEIVNVGKRCGTKTMTQDEINALMSGHARAQSPGGAAEERRSDAVWPGRGRDWALTEAGVAFEVVPGVSAAFAAAAALGCSLTDREWASNVIFSTGHHAQSHNRAPLPALEDATRVVYMPGRDLRLLAEQWLLEGLPADLPCAVVSRAAQPGQGVVHTTLGALGETEPAAAPSLLIAGWAVRAPGCGGAAGDGGRTGARAGIWGAGVGIVWLRIGVPPLPPAGVLYGSWLVSLSYVKFPTQESESTGVGCRL